MANTDLMIDLETLATSNDAAIVTMAAIRFDPHADYSKIKVEDLPPNQIMYRRIDLDSCTGIGCKVNEETIVWWATQPKEAQDEAFGDNGDRITIQDAMKELRKFSFGVKRPWSHGSCFDLMIIDHIMKKLEIGVPWSYYDIRDTRTLFGFGIPAEMPQADKHHALHDAYRQVIGVQNVIKGLKARGITVELDKKPWS